MSSSGEPLLCDFGVSRMLEASESFHFSSTLTGGLRGTIRYLSKELVLGSGKGIVTYSKESDVWAFGMTGIVSSWMFISWKGGLRHYRRFCKGNPLTHT